MPINKTQKRKKKKVGYCTCVTVRQSVHMYFFVAITTTATTTNDDDELQLRLQFYDERKIVVIYPFGMKMLIMHEWKISNRIYTVFDFASQKKTQGKKGEKKREHIKYVESELEGVAIERTAHQCHTYAIGVGKEKRDKALK